MPQRIQLRRSKGWRMPANTVKVDRSTRWGNPFRVGMPGIPDVDTAVRHFEAALLGGELSANQPHFTRECIVADLAGKNLACWCPLGGSCHGDVLLRIANG